MMLVLVLATASCNKDTEATSRTWAPAASYRFEVTVTENSFEPADITVPARVPVTLMFTRNTDKTCAKQVVVHLGATRRSRRRCR